MAPYVEQRVANIRDNPDEEGDVPLVVGVEDGATDVVIARINELGASKVEALPFASVLAKVPEQSVGDLCEIEGVTSVELDEGMEILAGN